MRHVRSIPLAAALAAASCAGLAACGDGSPVRPNIVLITLDTTRSDHLGCYGYERATSPNLDRLAAESMVYTNAYATTSWTLPAHASLFTGKLPTSHGAQYDPEGPLVLSEAVATEDTVHFRARGLGEGETTLAEALDSHGYATGGVVAGPWMKAVFGLGQGFASWDDTDIGELNGRSAESVTASASAWMRANADRPFFLFLNYYDPHAPYDPPRHRERFLQPGMDDVQRKNALYDAEILCMDEELGALFDELRSLGIYENTWIVVTADHGELMGEYGRFGHGQSLMQAEIRIPLIVKDPVAEPPRGTSEIAVQQTDVLPMILAHLGLDEAGGVPALPLEQVRHPVIAEVYPLPAMSSAGHWRVLIDGNYKFSWNSSGRHILADIGEDPIESRNLLEKEAERARVMSTALLGYLQSLDRPGPAGPAREIDEATRRALQKLGYAR